MSIKCLYLARYPITRVVLGYQRCFACNPKQWRHIYTTATQFTAGQRSALYIDNSAVKQISKVVADGSFLRVSVEGGGCSGFQYKFHLDDSCTEEDEVFENAGVKVVVDKMSLDLINGSTIVFEETLMSSAFQVTKNPQADTGCSCGVSFSLKL